jgi:hypothetical protein
MHERVLGDNYTFNNNYQGNTNYNNDTNASYYYSNYSHDNYRTLQNFIKVVNSQEDSTDNSFNFSYRLVTVFVNIVGSLAISCILGFDNIHFMQLYIKGRITYAQYNVLDRLVLKHIERVSRQS